MAEFLIRARDGATTGDATRDARDVYRRGDVVVIAPDGHPWGREEHPATATGRPFVIVKVPGLTVEQARRFAALDTITDPVTGRPVMRRRRRWRVEADALPLTVLRTLQGEGVVSVPWTVAREYVRDKVTRRTAAQDGL